MFVITRFVNLYRGSYFLDNRRAQLFLFFAPKGGDYSREGVYFKCCSLEVMPYIFCFIIPLNVKK